MTDKTIVITDPASPRVQAVFLRAHVRMFKAGMTHSKLTATRLRELVTKQTGMTYKRGQWDAMLVDLNQIING
jgi:hypothetical protein